jgi:hypothetical protein
MDVMTRPAVKAVGQGMSRRGVTAFNQALGLLGMARPAGLELQGGRFLTILQALSIMGGMAIRAAGHTRGQLGQGRGVRASLILVKLVRVTILASFQGRDKVLLGQFPAVRFQPPQTRRLQVHMALGAGDPAVHGMAVTFGVQEP